MTKLYPSASGVFYTPATIRGAWEKTTGHAICGMGGAKDLAGLGGPLSIGIAETIASTDYDVLLLRCVSAPLAANHSFSGTFNLLLGVQESATDADMAYYIHAFVTQGDTDNLRGTLLANYADPNTNEWGTTALGKALSAAATLTAVSALAGDRIVIEIGYRARNTTASTRTGTIWYGGSGSDLASGGAAAGGTGYFDFSDTFTLVDNPVLRVSQVALETVRRLSAEATEDQRREVERLAGALYDEKEALEERRKEEERRAALIEDIKNLTDEQTDAQEKYNQEMEELNKLLKEGAINQKEYEAASKRARDTMLQNSREWSAGLQRALQSYADEATDMASQVEQVVSNTMQNLEDVLVEFTTTGKFEWKDMVNSMLNDIARLIVRTQITGPLASGLNSWLGGLFGSAQGNVFANGMPVHAFGRGTVVFEPTIFPMAKGMGLMGEAGPEAIMPLRRLPSGRLGVEASGNGSSYMVNVDARGSTDPAATARQVEEAVDRALTARIPGIVRASATAARAEVVDSWQRRGGRFD